MEKKISVIPAIWIVFLQLGLLTLCAYHVYDNWEVMDKVLSWVFPAIVFILAIIIFGGYLVIQPNESRILSFLGKYKGTIKDNGFLFKNPFYGTFFWSLKVSNYATEVLKVNDKNGVPIEIAATIVWKVGDTYKAQYEVEDLNEYIDNQFEISLRKLAKDHTYSELSGEDRDFIEDLTKTASKAGVVILDAKITHLNYSAEMAPAMLQKQQAGAMSEAKAIIVENAVDIAESAAKRIEEMTREQKGKFISDLIIVLCSDRGVTPTVSVNN